MLLRWVIGRSYLKGFRTRIQTNGRSGIHLFALLLSVRVKVPGRQVEKALVEKALSSHLGGYVGWAAWGQDTGEKLFVELLTCRGQQSQDHRIPEGSESSEDSASGMQAEPSSWAVFASGASQKPQRFRPPRPARDQRRRRTCLTSDL